MFNSELYKLLVESSELDDKFIYKAFELMMSDEKKLGTFIEDFRIRDIRNKLGEYNLENRAIFVNKNAILESEDVTNKKVKAIEIIKHEMEHARNVSRLYEFRNDIESVLLGYALRDYAIINGLVPAKNEAEVLYRLSMMKWHAMLAYDYNPDERLARIRARKYVVNLLKNQNFTQDLLEARKGLYFAYVRGYEDNGVYLNAPSYEYLLHMGMLEEFYRLKQRVEREQYVFDTRLLYGLPLVKDTECDAKILKKVKLSKRTK